MSRTRGTEQRMRRAVSLPRDSDGPDKQAPRPQIPKQCPGGQHDILQRFPVVFPAVRGDDKNTLVVERQAVQFGLRKQLVLPDCGFQGINHSVPVTKCRCLRPRAEGFPRWRRWAKVQIGNGPGKPPVHLLRIGRIFVIGSKSRLHMPYLNLAVKGGQCAGKVVEVSPWTSTRSGCASSNTSSIPERHRVVISVRL